MRRTPSRLGDPPRRGRRPEKKKKTSVLGVAVPSRKEKCTHVFTTNLPPRLLLVELLRGLFVLEAHHDVALDRAQRADLGCARRRRHWPDRLLKRRRRWRVAVVSQLAVVQVALEEDEVRAREVEEQVGRLLGHAEEGVACAPEGVLLVDPLALRDVLLPPSAETPERLEISLARVLEEAAVHHHVEQPVPVFPGHIRHEPCKALAVEVDGLCETGLDEEVSYEQADKQKQMNKVNP